MAREVLRLQRGACGAARVGASEVVSERPFVRISLHLFSGRRLF